MFVSGCSPDATEGFLDSRVFDVARQEEYTLGAAVPKLRNQRIVFVGEYHTVKSHHEAQLKVIRALHESGIKVAVGLEMFRADSQELIDRWVQGAMQEKEFQRVYYDNWNYPWTQYSMIFHYCREMGIPMVGLNVPRAITRQVARGGFQSLSPKQKGKLPNVVCRVDKEYMDFIRKAFGAHAHGQLNFTYFCEAQLVWDKVMAIHALEYLKKEPERVMVVLAGTGHAWKMGIPTQIKQRSKLAYSVILPMVPEIIEPGRTSVEDADYIILDR
jgi:uncharacterized iron-regulated protein